MAVREFVSCGEGAITNIEQFIDLMEDYKSLNFAFPIVRFVDDECSNFVHLLKEMVNIARDLPIRHSSVSGVLALLCMDGAIDAFHFKKCHVEPFCKRFLNPFTRCFPPGWNSETVEQNWQELVKYCPSLTYMKEGNFRFMLLSIIMLQNMARSQTKVSLQPKKKAHSSWII